MLPTTCYPLPTTYYPLPTTYHPLPTTYYPLPTTYYPLPTTYYPLPTHPRHLVFLGNDEKHFSHVLSMAGAPHVNTNLSLSLANGLNHSCDVTITPRQIISLAASFLDSPDVFAPREQGPGTILVSTQSLAEKSLTRTVLTLSPSQLSSIFLKLRNMQSSLACVEQLTKSSNKCCSWQ